VGVIGIWFPHVFGVGYEAINEALNGTMLWHFMLLLVAFKILAVSVTIGSGGSGGIFAPSLFVGAMLGGGVGTVVNLLWPASTAGPGAYALVGMGAIVASATHAPITAILIIFELTGEYNIILPLMISCIIATLLATRLQASSIYTRKLLRRGIDIYKGRAVNVLDAVSVSEVVRTEMVTVSPEDRLGSLVTRFLGQAGTTLFVTDEDDRLLGVITADQIQPLMTDASALDALVIAQDVLVEGDFPTVTSATSLADVMRHLGHYRGEVPVLEGERLVGVIWPKDVIERYNTEVFKRDMARSMVAAVSQERTVEAVPAAEDTVVAEIPVPAAFSGRTIRDLDIRQTFGVSILMVKQVGTDGGERLETTPDASYVFKEDDVMLVMGPNEKIRHLRSGIPPDRKEESETARR
jgi:CIC family chloride channel protein